MPLSLRPLPVFLTCLCAAAPLSAATAPDYSKEGVIIQDFAHDVTFDATGTSHLIQTATIRVQSEAGVRAFGVLTFNYSNDNESVSIAYIRVRKPDGSVVETPAENVQDLSSEVARVAPTYSDLRQKQVPVKALSVGDTLEYKVTIDTTKPIIPGQFWYSENFITGVVVLKETLRISMPADKYVNVVSPTLKPEVHEEAGHKIYLWKTAQLEPSAQETDKKKPVPPPSPYPAVEVSTFRNWDELGRWYAALQADRVKVTAPIQSKADELTKGLTTPDAKLQALYNYVSTQFRYISISLGAGRYQPHFAADVLTNQYGDCKDKHTLFASLLKAAGIDAWPVLIGSAGKLDAAVPSPGQFDHVITVVPKQKDYVWLDTTPEVAPYGYLAPALREKQALVIPSNGPAVLMTTPLDLPFPNSQALDVNGTLSSEGTLKAHFDLTARGDFEVIYRAAFREVSPAQWQELVQSMVASMGFAGTVSNIDAGNPANLDKPFHFSYDYERKNFSDWDNRRITPPLFYISVPFNEGDEKPTEPIDLGASGELKYHATVHLPKDFSADLPDGVNAQASFAEYHSTYSVTGGVLSASRRFTLKSKVPVSAWGEYVPFAKKVQADQNQFLQLVSTANSAKAPAHSNPEAAKLVQQALESLQRHDLNSARDQLARAERLNPKERSLWSAYASLRFFSGDFGKVEEALEKEIKTTPDNIPAYKMLAQQQYQSGKHEQAIETLRSLLKITPEDSAAITRLASMLVEQKHYKEVPELLRPALAKSPDDLGLKIFIVQALLRGGQTEEGAAAAKQVGDSASDPMLLNDAAYELADAKVDLPSAIKYALKSVSLLETQAKDVSLATLNNEDFAVVNSLSSAWDTLGWAYFQSGDLDKAQKYIEAAWKLGQHPAAADHLGQIYAVQGKKEAAAHAWQLALAGNSALNETRERLRLIGTSPQPAQHSSVAQVRPEEELGKLRTTDLPDLPKQKGTAEFFVLFSARKVEDAEFISGDETLKNATASLIKAQYDLPVPDDGPERIPRRGILSCSVYTTPSCQFVLLLPSTTQK